MRLHCMKFVRQLSGERDRRDANCLHQSPFMLIKRALILFAAGIAVVQPLTAASFIVPADRHLVRQATAIVIGSALSSHTQLNADGGIETVTIVSVEEVLKGSIESDAFELYEPGGVYKDQAKVIPGVPRFNDGDRYILFLMQNGDGKWRVLDLGLGKFGFATDTLGHDVVVRDMHDVLTMDLDGSKHREANRAAEPFIDFIRQTGRGGPTEENYAIPAEPLIGSFPPVPQVRGSGLKPINLAITAGKWYTLTLDGTEGGTGGRWCGTVVAGSCVTAFPAAVHFHSIGSEPGAGGSPAGADAINAAMTAWNSAPGASVNYAYDGNDATGTTNAPNAIMGDGKNTIAFEYDLSAYGSPFVCGSGGLLGLGGISGTSGTHAGPNGDTFFTEVEGDVWMNKGIANCTSLFTSGDFNSAVTHEVGHTLALRHADQNRLGNAACSTDSNLECASSAIMTATVTTNLHASLQTWDQHAIAAVYPAAAAPAAPTGVVATATTPTNVQVSWNGVCGTACHIYRSADHLTYTQVPGTPATSPFNDTTAAANTAYLYKVRAFNGTESADSNIDLATTVIYTNTITAGSSIIFAVDLNEMRTAVDAVRTLDGIGAGFYTYGSGSPVRVVAGTDIIHAADINELRTNLNTAWNGLFGTTPTYTNTITAGSSVAQAIDFNEIRTKMQ
jgi:hypothetical protein